MMLAHRQTWLEKQNKLFGRDEKQISKKNSLATNSSLGSGTLWAFSSNDSSDGKISWLFDAHIKRALSILH